MNKFEQVNGGWSLCGRGSPCGSIVPHVPYRYRFLEHKTSKCASKCLVTSLFNYILYLHFGSFRTVCQNVFSKKYI